MNYFNLLYDKAKNNKDKAFIILDKKIYTYKDIYEDSKKIGEVIYNKYKKDNLSNSIFIYSKDLYFQLVIFFAINSFRGVPIILHYGISNEVIKELMKKNNVELIISNENLNIDGTKKLYLNTFENNFYMYSNRENKEYKYSLYKQACMGVLTSGSTGIPKVLYRSYKSWVDFFKVQNNIFKVDSNSKLFINGDASFTGNLNVIMSILYEGATIVTESKFNPKKWIKSIEKNNVTNIYLVPTKLKILSKVLFEDFDNIKSIFTGSQLLFEDTADTLRKYFNKSEIILYYGASELNYITYLKYEEIKKKPLSVGRPFPGVKIFTENDLIYANTKYNVENIKHPFTVSDSGYIDEDGYLIFQGRKDDVVNIGGVKVSSIKIENELKSINKVEDAVVISYEHNIRGKEMCAFIVSTEKVTRDYIIKELKNSLMNIEIPKRILFIKRIPINNIGKVNKKILFEVLRKTIP